MWIRKFKLKTIQYYEYFKLENAQNSILLQLRYKLILAKKHQEVNTIYYLSEYLLHLLSPSLFTIPFSTKTNNSLCIVFSLQSFMTFEKSLIVS